MRKPTMTADLDNPRGQDIIPGAGAQVQLIRDLQMVVVCETPGVMCTVCWLGFSHVGCISIRVAATLSDISDCLSVAVIS
jgi:hypothetical protein